MQLKSKISHFLKDLIGKTKITSITLKLNKQKNHPPLPSNFSTTKTKAKSHFMRGLISSKPPTVKACSHKSIIIAPLYSVMRDEAEHKVQAKAHYWKILCVIIQYHHC